MEALVVAPVVAVAVVEGEEVVVVAVVAGDAVEDAEAGVVALDSMDVAVVVITSLYH